MNNTRLLTIGACMAVLAAVLATGIQRLFGGGTNTESASGQVMCAKTELPAGHRLTEEDVEPRQATIGTGPKAASTEARQLVGRTLSAPLRKGQVVRQEHLAAKGSGMDIASQIPPGHRALTVVLRDPMAATSLFPGALVDVLVTMDRGGSGSNRETVTRVAAERARVLALADDTSAGRAAAGATREGTFALSTNERRQVIKKVAVTLDVTAEQAAELELAAGRGTVGLALRPESDDATTAAMASTQGVTPNQPPAQAAPTATPAANTAVNAAKSSSRSSWEVIVIRGDERVKHDFPPRDGNSTP
jgi:Flp pilus assembly protein CpaB